MVKGKLNVDVAEAINSLQAMLKYFKLKQDIYRILFRGKGLEFEGYRKFSPDDDASDIDWKASNRSQSLLVKQYKEERDLKVMFLVDVGDNMVFGSTPKLKCEYATELISALSQIIINSNDRVGFFFFSDMISHFMDSKGGQRHFHFFVDLLSDGKNYGGNTNLNQALDFAMDYFNKSISSVIIVSDFIGINADTERKLSLLSHMFETILIRIKDPLDFSLPDIGGEVVLEDPATHEQIMINPKIARNNYERFSFEHELFVKGIFKRIEADFLDLTTDQEFAVPLALFLKERRVGVQ